MVASSRRRAPGGLHSKARQEIKRHAPRSGPQESLPTSAPGETAMLPKITLALAFALAVSFAATASAQQHIPGSSEAFNGLVWDPPGYADAAREAAPDVT